MVYDSYEQISSDLTLKTPKIGVVRVKCDTY